MVSWDFQDLKKLLTYLETNSPNDDHVHKKLEALGWTEETWIEVEGFRKAASIELPILLQTVFGISSDQED